MTRGDRVLDRLRADHPGWDIGPPAGHVGEPGVWPATRTGVLSTAEMHDGLLHTLVGDTAEQLGNALAEQQRIELGLSREPARAVRPPAGAAVRPFTASDRGCAGASGSGVARVPTPSSYDPARAHPGKGAGSYDIPPTP
jgi:hypothetical protein